MIGAEIQQFWPTSVISQFAISITGTLKTDRMVLFLAFHQRISLLKHIIHRAAPELLCDH